jgi:hypothetical protein
MSVAFGSRGRSRGLMWTNSHCSERRCKRQVTVAMLKPPSGPRRRVGPLPPLHLRASQPARRCSERGAWLEGSSCPRDAMGVHDLPSATLRPRGPTHRSRTTPGRPQDGPALSARESPTRRLEQAMAAGAAPCCRPTPTRWRTPMPSCWNSARRRAGPRGLNFRGLG